MQYQGNLRPSENQTQCLKPSSQGAETCSSHEQILRNKLKGPSWGLLGGVKSHWQACWYQKPYKLLRGRLRFAGSYCHCQAMLPPFSSCCERGTCCSTRAVSQQGGWKGGIVIVKTEELHTHRHTQAHSHIPTPPLIPVKGSCEFRSEVQSNWGDSAMNGSMWLTSLGDSTSRHGMRCVEVILRCCGLP